MSLTRFLWSGEVMGFEVRVAVVLGTAMGFSGDIT